MQAAARPRAPRLSATLGGTALYLLAHVAFRWRNVHRFSTQRLLYQAACYLRDYGLHLADGNIAPGNLTDLVRRQGRNYLE